MIDNKTIWRFAVIFLIAYLILFLPSTFQQIYSGVYRSAGNTLFSTFGDSGIVIIKPQQKEKFDNILFIARKDLKKGTEHVAKRFDISSYQVGLLPAVFFLSLVIASSISWKRKLFASITGFILILIYQMIKLRILILYSYSITSALGLYQEYPIKRSIKFWYENFAFQKTPDYTFVLILWAALCIGKKEWAKMNAAFSGLAAKQKQNGNRKKK